MPLQPVRVAFVLRSRSGYAHLKMFGPLLAHWFNHRPLGDDGLVPLLIIQKPLPEVPQALLRGLGRNFARIEQVRTDFDAGLIDVIRAREIRVVIAAGPGNRYPAARAATRPAGVRWVAIPHNHEEIWLTARLPHESVDGWDLIGYITERGRRIAGSFLEESVPELTARFDGISRVFGNTVLDQVSGIDPVEVIARHKLPRDMPIVLFSPFTVWRNRRTWNALQRRVVAAAFLRSRALSSIARRLIAPLVVRGFRLPLINYEFVLTRLRRFADRQGALLLGKSKPRFQDARARALDRQYLDVWFDDECYFPFTTTDLCAVSSLFIGMYSSAAIEAIATNSYSISLAPFSHLQFLEVTNDSAQDIYRQELFEGTGGLHNAPGLSETIQLYEREGVDRLRALEGRTLSSLRPDLSRRAALNERTLGAPPHDGPSNAAVTWGHIRNLVGTSE